MLTIEEHQPLMSQSITGPLLAVTIDPLNGAHVDELTRQRIKCGWSAEQVPEWMEEIKRGVRTAWIYYEADTNLPVGSAAITTLSHEGAMKVGDALPDSTIGVCSLYVDSSFRGKSYGNVIMAHRHSLAFSDPKVDKCILDTMARFKTLQAWHSRLGYVQIGEPSRLFENSRDLPPYMRAMSENLDDWKISIFELTRERWMEGFARERLSKDGETLAGIPVQLPGTPVYTDSKAQES